MDNDQKTATLPPIPGSDEQSLRFNPMDNFYKIKPRDFWDKNEIVREKPEDFKKCEHYFVANPQGAQCKKCKIGFIGFFEIQDGKLFHEGEPLGI